MNLTVIIPFYAGHKFLPKLLDTLPQNLPVIVVNDQSPGGEIDVSKWPNARVVSTREHGYFAGAVNRGLEELSPEQNALILNQDVWFTGDGWLSQLEKQSRGAGLVGDFVVKNKWHRVGYVQGTFMYIRADVRAKLGPLDAESYPHWGVTCLYQMRASRAGFKAEKLHGLTKWFKHARDFQAGSQRYGMATRRVLQQANDATQRRLIVTPPLVSVVVPAYNKAPYLAEALDSLLVDSTFQDFELTIIDDGSTDNTKEVLREYLERWGDIRVSKPGRQEARHGIKERWDSPWIYVRVFFTKNRGVPHARNLGVLRSIAPLIFQLDADDKVHPTGLARMVAAFARNPHRWVYSDLQCFGESDERRVFPEFDIPHPAAIAERNVAPSCILYHRLWWQEVGGYHPRTARGHDDWGFGIQLFLARHCGQRLQGIDGDSTPAVYYRKTTGSRNATSRRRARELINTRRELWPRVFVMYKERKPDTMACCGKGGRRPARSATVVKQLTPTADKGALIWVTYTGNAKASFPALGTVTKERYTILPDKPFQIFEADFRYLRKFGLERYNPPAPYIPKVESVKQPTEVVAGDMLTANNVDEPEGMEFTDDTDEQTPAEDTAGLEEILQGRISAVMDTAAGMDNDELAALIDAERAGKGRVTLITKLEELAINE